jgi:hypothetical protein
VATTIRVLADRVTLRSASCRPGSVVLDGAFDVGDLASVEADGGVVAELGLARSGCHLVHAVPPQGRPAIAGVLLYRLASSPPRSGERVDGAAEQFRGDLLRGGAGGACRALLGGPARDAR